MDIRNKTTGGGEFFPKGVLQDKVFPFPIFFQKQLKAEWSKPASNRQSPPTVKKLYKLPTFANEMLRVPLVLPLWPFSPTVCSLRTDRDILEISGTERLIQV